MPELKIAEAFGEAGNVREIAGRQIVVRFLDVNDLIDIERRLGSVSSIDQSNFEHIRFLFWLILRKGDPSLSQDDIEEQRYPLTEKAAGAGLTMRTIKSKAVESFIREVMIGSGLVEDPNETRDPNA